MKALKWLFAILVSIVLVRVMMAAADPKLEADRKQKAADAVRQKQEAQAAYLDSWKKWAEEGKKKTDEKAKQPSDPNWKSGFEVGFTAGHIMARGGSEKPASSKLDAMARKSARSRDLDETARSQYTRGYSAGFSYGWSKGN